MSLADLGYTGDNREYDGGSSRMTKQNDFQIGGNCWKPKIPTRDRKIIIFDSPDGTGKTNIAQALSMDLKIPYFRMDTQHQNWKKGRFKEALEFDQPYLAEFIRQTKTDVIIDRAYPAEWVYSRVYNRPTNEEVLKQVDEAFARMGAYIVIPVRHDYSKTRKDDLVSEEALPTLHEKYLEFTKWTKCSTIVIYVDAFENDLKREIEKLREELSFNRPLNFAYNVVLGNTLTEKKDVSSVFDNLDQSLRELQIKGK